MFLRADGSPARLSAPRRAQHCPTLPTSLTRTARPGERVGSRLPMEVEKQNSQGMDNSTEDLKQRFINGNRGSEFLQAKVPRHKQPFIGGFGNAFRK